MEPKKDLPQLAEALLGAVSSVGQSNIPFIVPDLLKTFYRKVLCNVIEVGFRVGVEGGVPCDLGSV